MDPTEDDAATTEWSHLFDQVHENLDMERPNPWY